MSIPLINGVTRSWAQVQILIGGLPFMGVRGINYSTKRVVNQHYGIGDEPVSRGYGNKSYDSGSIEISLDDWKAICASAPNGDPTLLAPFQIKVIWAPTENMVITDSETLQNVVFTNNGRSLKSGDTIHYHTASFDWAGLA